MDKQPVSTNAYHLEDSMEKKDPELATTPNVASTADTGDDDFKFTFGKFMAILSFQLGYFSDTFLIVMLSAALTTINRDIGPNVNYTWIATGFLVTGGALAPVVGRFGDIFGRRNFLLIGNLLSVIGTITAANAHTINAVIAGSCLAGCASSMRQLAWSCLGELVPKRSRGLAFGIFQSSLSPASAFGAIVAYAMINNGSWRPIFWLAFALDLSSLILVFLFYHPINQYIKEEGQTVWARVMETDFIGCFLFITGLVLFLLGISFGGNQFPWTSAGTIAPIVLGFALLVACGIYESKANIKFPIFPPAIFRNIRGFTVLQVGIFLIGMLFYATSIIWPQQVQSLYSQDNITIGWYSCALGLGGMVAAPIYGYILKKYKHAHWIFIITMIVMTAMCGAQAIVTPTSNVGSTILVPLIGATVAGATVISTVMVQVGVKHEYIGIASGVLVCARTVGGAVATTIYVSILQNKFQSNLLPDVAIPLAMSGVPEHSIEEVIEALLTADLTNPVLATLTHVQLGTAATGIKDAFAGAFKLVYLVSIAFGIIAVVVVCFAANVDHLLTHETEMKLEEGAHIHSHNTDTGGGHIIGKNMDL